MSDIGIALLVAIPVTILLAFIQLIADSKKYDPRCYWTLFLIFYVFILYIGNFVSVMIAPSVIDSHLSAIASKSGSKSLTFPGPPWAWYTFTGIFAFEIMIKRINLTFFDKGVLSISDWITKAKNNAVAATLEKAADVEIRDKTQLGQQLYDRFHGNNHIQTFAMQHLGEDLYARIAASLATRQDINVELYLANLIANEKPKVVRSMLKN